MNDIFYYTSFQKLLTKTPSQEASVNLELPRCIYACVYRIAIHFKRDYIYWPNQDAEMYAYMEVFTQHQKY